MIWQQSISNNNNQLLISIDKVEPCQGLAFGFGGGIEQGDAFEKVIELFFVGKNVSLIYTTIKDMVVLAIS